VTIQRKLADVLEWIPSRSEHRASHVDELVRRSVVTDRCPHHNEMRPTVIRDVCNRRDALFVRTLHLDQ
jgi:hypothetical protein